MPYAVVTKTPSQALPFSREGGVGVHGELE